MNEIRFSFIILWGLEVFWDFFFMVYRSDDPFEQMLLWQRCTGLVMEELVYPNLWNYSYYNWTMPSMKSWLWSSLHAQAGCFWNCPSHGGLIQPLTGCTIFAKDVKRLSETFGVWDLQADLSSLSSSTVAVDLCFNLIKHQRIHGGRFLSSPQLTLLSSSGLCEFISRGPATRDTKFWWTNVCLHCRKWTLWWRRSLKYCLSSNNHSFA